MKKIIFLVIFVIFWKNLLFANTCQDYTYIPPSFVASVPPTVMIALDVSGSMSWDAYLEPYDENKIYEGLFDPSKNYRYNGGKWVETTNQAHECPLPTYITYYLKYRNWRYRQNVFENNVSYSGSCLNYWIMSRIDVFRWAMTGGVPEECPGANGNTQKCDPEFACDGDYCDIETYSGTVIELLVNDPDNHHGIMDAVLYQLKEKENKPRIGVMFFAGSGITSNGRSVYVGDFLTSNSTDDDYPYKNLITSINTVRVSGSTPSGPAMWDVWNYYLQNNPEYGGLEPDRGSQSSNHYKDPLWLCSNSEGNGLTCVFAPCSNNYVILASDGQWNTPSNEIDDLDWHDNSPDPVVPAYIMHKGAVRQKDNQFVKIDAVYTLGMFLGGTGEQSLKNVAMFGAFKYDKNHNLWPGGTQEEQYLESEFHQEYGNDTHFPDNSCYMDDAGNGQGSACEPLPSSHSDWDEDGDGLPDTFFNAKNALELKEKLIAIFSDIMRRASSGTSVATTSTEKGDALMLFQAYYYPNFVLDNNSGSVNWIGDLRSYFIDDNDNIREDTDSDDKMDFVDDKILIFKFIDYLQDDNVSVAKTFGFRIDDNDEDMIPDECSINEDERIELVSLSPIWSASNYLKSLVNDNRLIFYNNCDNNSECDFENNFTVNNKSDIANYWDLDLSFAEKLIKYIRGYDNPGGNTGFRSRNFENTNSQIFEGVYKLGDIINSSPIVLKNDAVNMYDIVYRDASYYSFILSDEVKDRTNVVFVGANDGMVHAFISGKIQKSSDQDHDIEVVNKDNEELGKELWAFIPKNALPYLRWYYKEGKDCHVPKVDYRFMLVDASIGNESEKEESWRTILIGMMGFGGKEININGVNYSSSVFVIDVTDPNHAKLLWETSLPDHSLTLSHPTIVRLGDGNEKGEWYLVIGSGPLNPNGTEFLSDAKIYFYDLKTGNLINSLSVGNDIAIGDLQALDIDHDYQVDMVVFGTYSSPMVEKGGVYGVFLRNGIDYIEVQNLTNDNVKKIFDTDSDNDEPIKRPVFGRIENTIDDEGKLWLFFNTGRFLTTDDKIDNLQQYIIGIRDKDEGWKDGNGRGIEIDSDDLFNATNTTVSATVEKVKCYCFGVECGSPQVTVNNDTYIYTCDKGEPVVTDVYADIINDPSNICDNKSVEACASIISDNYSGWYVEMYERERAYSMPFLAGDILDVVGFVPNEDVCSYGGNSILHALYYKTGTPGPQPMFLSNTVDENDNEIQILNKEVEFTKSLDLGSGAPPIGNPIAALPSENGEFTKLIQTSVGAVIKQRQQGKDTSSKLIYKILR